MTRVPAARLVAARLVAARLVAARLVAARLVAARLVAARLVAARLVAARLVAARLVAARLVAALAESSAFFVTRVAGFDCSSAPGFFGLIFLFAIAFLLIEYLDMMLLDGPGVCLFGHTNAVILRRSLV